MAQIKFLPQLDSKLQPGTGGMYNGVGPSNTYGLVSVRKPGSIWEKTGGKEGSLSAIMVV